MLRTALVGLAALAIPASAVAQEARCVSRAESRAVVANLMPALLTSAARHCGPQLGARSYLAANAPRLAQRLAAHGEASWPVAQRAIETIGGNPLPDNPALLELGRQALATGITGKMDANACIAVDALAEQLAPLPAENFANVFALFLEMGVNADKKAAIKVCPAPAQKFGG